MISLDLRRALHINNYVCHINEDPRMQNSNELNLIKYFIAERCARKRKLQQMNDAN